MSTFKTAKGTELPILNLKGKDYLQVMHRIVWFREEHPDWTIETEFLTITDKMSVAKATIKNAEGRIMATSHKREDATGFADHSEKAETGAIGRALALCSYGTQFTAHELDEGNRLADSPAPSRQTQEYQFSHSAKNNQPGPEDGGGVSKFEFKASFGKFKGLTIKQIQDQFPAHVIDGWIDWLKKDAEFKGKPLSANAVDLIDRIEKAMGALENNHTN